MSTAIYAIENEEARLRALHDLALIDTPPSESYDRITRMASRFFEAPISAVSLTDRHRQWFKSQVGCSTQEIVRHQAPCAEVTRTSGLLVVPDLLEDRRFADSPLARSGVRFYAGAPLVTREGFALGSMCVLDSKPRDLSASQTGSLTDFAAIVMAQIELEHNYGRVDHLSGLPNRNQLMEDLEDLNRDYPGEERVNILIDLVDPRSFNQLVSVLGTEYIDEMMKASSRALRETLGRRKGLYQVGVGSFLVVLNEQEGEVWREVMDRISCRLRTPVVCRGIPVTIDAAFGISSCRLGSCVPSEAVRTAVSAAHQAREAELEFAIYSKTSDQASRRRLNLLTDIRQALKLPGHLSLAYQPRIDLRSDRCEGAEALLRWESPQLGNVSPGEFIPLVEQTALARPVTEWVIGAALDQAKEWRGRGVEMNISINISALNLEEPDFARRLADAIDAHHVPPSAVELEFTESALIRNGARVLGQLREVRSIGVSLAIDDFGTGYSTFSYLREIPANIVKIDQSFMQRLTGSRRDQRLVQSMIDMAHDLGYRVVAEGVETLEAYRFLAEAGCDEAQGYVIAHPLKPVLFEDWFLQTGRMTAMIESRSLAEMTLPERIRA